MSDIVSVEAHEDETGLYVEPRELLARDLWTGARLWTAAQAFFFLTFVFAFFYLRSLNTNNMWRPHGVNPPMGYGGTILGCIVASAAIYWLGVRAYGTRGERVWRLAAAVALALGVAAIVVQSVEWAAMSWGPTDGGYASVFIGWTGFYVLSLLGGVYWMETLVAESTRFRKDSEPGGAVVVRRANAEALNVFWGFLAAVGVIAFVLLYLVA
jgi:heme/copper-type cytochrome/quinol oxidase subunit 3